MVQDSFVQESEGVEFGGREEADEMLPDVVHVRWCRPFDRPPPGRLEADHDAACVLGVGLAGYQTALLHAPHLVGKPALLPHERGAQVFTS